MVDAITGITGGSSSGSTTSLSKLSDDFDSFLVLLTTQLQNQDPSEPLDTNEFTNQLVQFASVEQQIGQSELLEQLVAKTGQNDFLSASTLVGKDVEVFGNQTRIEDGDADISKSFVYAHALDVEETNITVYDANNSIVYTTAGETGPGKHTFTWDGTNMGGDVVPEGTYTVTVEAAAKGTTELEPIATNIVALVDEVLFAGDQVFVSLMGSFTVPFDDVVAVSSPD